MAQVNVSPLSTEGRGTLSGTKKEEKDKMKRRKQKLEKNKGNKGEIGGKKSTFVKQYVLLVSFLQI